MRVWPQQLIGLAAATLVLGSCFATDSAAAGRSEVSADPSILHVCENTNTYPPFRWFSSDAHGQRYLHGYTYALFDQLLAGSGYRYDIRLLPLTRCLREVQNGLHYQLMLNGSYSDSRAEIYRLSSATREVHFHAFYALKKYPEQPPLQRVNDLIRFRLCGVQGANFSMFKVKENRFDMGADSLDAVMEKLRRDRCDILPYNWEVVESHAGQQPELLKGIGHVVLEDMPVGQFTIIISRQAGQGEKIQQLINARLAVMRDSGALHDFWLDPSHRAWKTPIKKLGDEERTELLPLDMVSPQASPLR